MLEASMQLLLRKGGKQWCCSQACLETARERDQERRRVRAPLAAWWCGEMQLRPSSYLVVCVCDGRPWGGKPSRWSPS